MRPRTRRATLLSGLRPISPLPAILTRGDDASRPPEPPGAGLRPAGRTRGDHSALGGVVTAVLAAGAGRAAYAVLTRRPPGGDGPWTKTNHRGEAVTLLEGPAVAVAAAAAASLSPGLPARARAAMVAAGIGAAAFGGYDDLAGSGDRRGFRGHLGALARGEVTTGAVKLGGIGASGLASAAALGGPPADVAINAALAAGGANLLNLFDLRPGRAIKVALAVGTLVAAAAPPRRRGVAARGVAPPLGAALALLPDDLGERAMLGDAGANALGAMLGTAAAASLPRGGRIALLAGIAGLTAASEVVSFTTVIERTPSLRWLDMLGRRPAVPGPAAARPAESVSSRCDVADRVPAPATAGDMAAARQDSAAEPDSHDGEARSVSRSRSNSASP